MAFTQTAKEFYHYCNTHEFIPPTVLEDFHERLEREDNLIVFSVGLEEFIMETCANCNTAGAYKWHFMGKLTHPDCGWFWYVNPGEYAKKQLGASFRAGMNIAAEAYSDAERKGEKGTGCVGAIFSFFIGLSFRLPFAIAMSLIQPIAYFTQKKPESQTR